MTQSADEKSRILLEQFPMVIVWNLMPSLTGTYLVLWMCLGSYLATALGIPAGIVLCVGSNGHVAYEPSDLARVCVATDVSNTSVTDDLGRWISPMRTFFNVSGAVPIGSNRTCTD